MCSVIFCCSDIVSAKYLRQIDEAAAAAASLQLCPTLCDSIDGSPPSSFVPGILQARILEWVAVSFSSRWGLGWLYLPLEMNDGEGSGTPLQYSCLENPMNGGAWWAAVHGVARVGHDWATSLSLFTSCIGEGNGNPLQCSCLENPRDRGAW